MNKLWITRIKDFLLSALFPSPAHIEEIEKMDVALFSEKVGYNTREIYKNIDALFPYRNKYGHLAMRALKYKGNDIIARLLASVLYEEILSWNEEELNAKKYVIVPIPLSEKRLRERGYNQCELVLDAFSKINTDGLAIVEKNTLIKIHDTESQTAMKNRKAREENIKGCFAVAKPEAIRGKHIIVLDDIVTTGSTIREALKTLRQSGAKSVRAIALAY